MLVWSITLRTSSAVYRIPYLSLGAELSRDYDDRTKTMGLRTLFGLLGTLGAAALSFLIFFPPSVDGSEPKLHYAGYPRMGLAFGAVMTIAGLIGTLGTLRYRTSGGGKDSAGPRFFSGFRIAMRNRSFRSIWCSTTVFFLAVVLNFSMAIHYFTWYAHISRSEILSLIQSCFYMGALGGVVLWMSLARRTEKRTLYIMAAVSSAMFVADGHLADRCRPAPGHRPSLPVDRRARHRRHFRQRGLGGPGVHDRRRDRYRPTGHRTAARRHIFRHYEFRGKGRRREAPCCAPAACWRFSAGYRTAPPTARPAILRPPFLTWACYTAPCRLRS